MPNIQLPTGEVVAVPDGLSDSDFQSMMNDLAQQAKSAASDQSGGERPTFTSRALEMLKGMALAPTALAGDPTGLMGLGANAQLGQTALAAAKGEGDYGYYRPIDRAATVVGNGVTALLPGVGPLIAQSGEDLGDKNWGALGADSLALFGSEYLPRAMGLVAPGWASKMYRSAIPALNREKLSLPQIKGAAQFGIDKLIPNSEGGIVKTGDLIRGLNEQANDILTDQGQESRPINPATATREVENDIKALNQSSTNKALATDLQKRLDEWKDANQGMTVGAAQAAKRSIYKELSESNWSDTNNSVPPAERRFNTEIARGLKNSVNELFPEMEQVNNHMQNAIDLQDALISEAKRNPSSWRNIAPWILGGEGARFAVEGHPMLAAGELAATILSNPAMRTRTAMMLGRSPQIMRALGYATTYAGATPSLTSLTYDPQNPPSFNLP